MVLFGYILFVSLFDQIVTQNEGFFYVIVFGGILVLAFILLHLMTKLLAISREVEDRKLWYVTEVVSVLALFVLFFHMRLSYVSSLPAQDAVFYKTAVLLKKQMLSVGGMDLLPQLMRNPAQYAYSILIWLVFLVTGENPSIIVYINTAILFLTVFFVYRIVRRIGGRVCGILSVACSLFMPCQAFTVYSYNTELFFSCIFFAALSLLVCLTDQDNEKKWFSLLLYGIFGLLLGALLFTEPLAVIIAMLLLIVIFRRPEKSWLSGFVSLTAMLAVFLVLFFLKCDSLECTSGELIQAYGGRFLVTTNTETGEQYAAGQILSSFYALLDSQNASIVDNYYFLTRTDGQIYSALQAAWFQLGNQLLYLFLIVLSIACTYYVMRGKRIKIVPCLLSLIGAVVVLFLSTNKENNTWFFVELLIIIACVSLYYLYESYHPIAETVPESTKPLQTEEDGIIKGETEEEKELWLARARALIFFGENDALYEEIKTEEIAGKAKEDYNEPVKEEKKMIKFLENPLPLPKPHVSKEMDYSLDMETDSDLDFDIEIEEDDDFEV